MICVEELSIRQGSFELTKISFEIPTGRHAILMGDNGSGKTTILEAICGLRPIQSGKVRLNGIDVTTHKPAERGIGYVPQDGALFTTMSVRDNLAFSMVIRRWQRDAVEARVRELVDLLGIEPLLDRMPAKLSGGEIQRVALGRALASGPGILCLDEPLGAIDEQTRVEMHELLRQIRQRTSVTILHVTHSQAEARELGDLILSLRGRKIEPLPITADAATGHNTD